MIHKLLPTETVLDDSTPVHYGYVYIVDNVSVRCNGEVNTVGEWKDRFGVKEVSRCELFGHDDAKLGDKII